MNHGLLVPRLVVSEQLGPLVQGLADAGHIAVAEDPEAAPEEPLLDPIAFDVLRSEETNQCLRGGEPHGPARPTSALIASSSCSNSVS